MEKMTKAEAIDYLRNNFVPRINKLAHESGLRAAERDAYLDIVDRLNIFLNGVED